MRDVEREILPMIKSEGMAIAPWGSLGGGKFKTEEQINEYKEKGEETRKFLMGGIDEKTRNITKVLDKLAKAKGVSITGIALSYVMQKAPYVFPIVGVRKAEQLRDNINALSKVTLSPEEIKELEDASPFELGFPHNLLGGTKPGNFFLMNASGKYEFVTEEQPIVPHPQKK